MSDNLQPAIDRLRRGLAYDERVRGDKSSARDDVAAVLDALDEAQRLRDESIRLRGCKAFKERAEAAEAERDRAQEEAEILVGSNRELIRDLDAANNRVDAAEAERDALQDQLESYDVIVALRAAEAKLARIAEALPEFAYAKILCDIRDILNGGKPE